LAFTVRATLDVKFPARAMLRCTGCALEMCMGMGKTGIPWVPWDSHGDGNTISHEMGMGLRCVGNGN